MKQQNHMDISAMLRELPEMVSQEMSDVQATPFLKTRIDRAVAEHRQGRVRITLTRWLPAVCCAAVMLVVGLIMLPMGGGNKPTELIRSDALGPSAPPAEMLSSDLSRGSVFISTGTSKPGYRSIWADVKDGSFPLIGLNGRYYRMLTSPASVNGALLGAQVASVSEFTREPSLSGTDAVLSNAATAGTPVYAIRGLNENTLVAAEVNGRMRLFQRVSFNGHALRGREQLSETLAISGRVIAMELTGVGTVTDPATCESLLSTLLNCANYSSSGSISSKKALLIELDNGLVLQMAVKGDSLAACGVWSCPEFFERFELACE